MTVEARVNTDVRRGGDYRSGRRYYRGGYGRYYGGYYGRAYYPYYWPGWYSSFYWWGPPAYYAAAYRYGDDHYYSSRSGALDLDIKPEEAEIWVDGEYVGIADNFDGFPRYLWLPEGDHRLVFYLDGYRTAAREFTIEEGVVLQVKTKMEQGESKPAAEFFPKPDTRAKARIQADRERAAEAERRRPYRYSERDRDEESDDESWRERRESSPVESSGRSGDFRAEPARLILEVDPSDAVVYLDGRLLGSGDELARLHSALLIDAGEHELEVVRPGYDSETVEFEVEAGEDFELEVELDRD